jgi:putative peptidoglycan lipid II flippase
MQSVSAPELHGGDAASQRPLPHTPAQGGDVSQRSGEEPRRGQLTAVAAVLAASVLLSRLLGYVRDAVLAWRIGASSEADAYYAAFILPDMLNYLLAGGALAIAFIPFYSRLRSREGQAAAEHFFAVVLGTTSAVAVVLTLLLWWQADAMVAVQFPRFAPATRELAVHLTRILLPAQIFFIAGGVIRGALMAHSRFATQALAPVLYNLGIIAGGVVLGGTLGAEGFAWGALAGALVGPFLAPLVDALRCAVPRVGLRVAPFDRDFLRYLVVALPLMIGVSLVTVDEWYGRWFGALLPSGTVAHLAYARRLMLVPVAIVGQAIATAALPLLARLWSEGRRDEMHATLVETLRAGFGLAVLASVAFLVFAEPIVFLLYERGRFLAADTQQVVPLLRIFALAVPAWVVQQIAVRAFYARGDTWRPMVLATLIALAAAGLYWVMGEHFGVQGLAWAGVLGMSASALATLGLARALHGGPALGPLLTTALRATACAALAGALAAGLLALLSWPGPGALGALLALGLGGACYAAALLLAIRFIGDAALRGAMGRLVQPLRRRAP